MCRYFLKQVEVWEETLQQGGVKHFLLLKEKIRKQLWKCFEDLKKTDLLAQFITSPFLEIDTDEFSTYVTRQFQGGSPGVVHLLLSRVICP